VREAVEEIVREGRREVERRRRDVESILSTMRDARDEQMRAGYRIGKALSALLRQRLLQIAGLSFEAAAAEAGYGRSQAFKLVTIAEQLSETETLALGYEAAYRRALTLAAKTKVRARRSPRGVTAKTR
jgi:hypothetical protein